MAAIFESPLSFTYHVGKDIIVNGVNIFKDIEQAIADEQKGDFLNMGRDIGKALALLILGQGMQVVPGAPEPIDGLIFINEANTTTNASDLFIIQWIKNIW